MHFGSSGKEIKLLSEQSNHLHFGSSGNSDN